MWDLRRPAGEAGPGCRAAEHLLDGAPSGNGSVPAPPLVGAASSSATALPSSSPSSRTHTSRSITVACSSRRSRAPRPRSPTSRLTDPRPDRGAGRREVRAQERVHGPQRAFGGGVAAERQPRIEVAAAAAPQRRKSAPPVGGTPEQPGDDEHRELRGVAGDRSTGPPSGRGRRAGSPRCAAPSARRRRRPGGEGGAHQPANRVWSGGSTTRWTAARPPRGASSSPKRSAQRISRESRNGPSRHRSDPTQDVARQRVRHVTSPRVLGRGPAGAQLLGSGRAGPAPRVAQQSGTGSPRRSPRRRKTVGGRAARPTR